MWKLIKDKILKLYFIYLLKKAIKEDDFSPYLYKAITIFKIELIKKYTVDIGMKLTITNKKKNVALLIEELNIAIDTAGNRKFNKRIKSSSEDTYTMVLDDFLVDNQNIPIDLLNAIVLIKGTFLVLKDVIEKQDSDYKKYYQRQYKSLEKDVLNFLIPIGILIKNI